jgi:hypothetical protein
VICCCIPAWSPAENLSLMSFSGGCRVRTMVKVERRWLLVPILARFSVIKAFIKNQRTGVH